MAIAVAARAVQVASRAVSFWSILAGGLVIGAGFNGASFLDFNNISSLMLEIWATHGTDYSPSTSCVRVVGSVLI